MNERKIRDGLEIGRRGWSIRKWSRRGLGRLNWKRWMKRWIIWSNSFRNCLDDVQQQGLVQSMQLLFVQLKDFITHFVRLENIKAKRNLSHSREACDDFGQWMTLHLVGLNFVRRFQNIQDVVGSNVCLQILLAEDLERWWLWNNE